MSRDVDGKKSLKFRVRKYEIDNEEHDTEIPKFMEEMEHVLNVDIVLLRAHVRPEVTHL